MLIFCYVFHLLMCFLSHYIYFAIRSNRVMKNRKCLLKIKLKLLTVSLGVFLVAMIYLNFLPTGKVTHTSDLPMGDDLLDFTRRITKTNLKDPIWFKNFLKYGCSPNCLRYPIYVTSLTSKSSLLPEGFREMSEYIVSRINENFKMENGKKIVDFYLKGYDNKRYRWRYDRGKCRQLMKMGDGEVLGSEGHKYYSSSEWSDAFLNCDVKSDKTALNVYIYDGYDSLGDPADETGRGFPNNRDEFQSMVLIDYQRLIDDYNLEEAQSPSAHEVGHSFTLEHVCDLNASDPSYDTNLMASSGSIKITKDHSVYRGNNGISYDCPKSGGNRDLGLTASQTITVLEAIVKQQDYWLDAEYN